jgi:hypothetical protein
MLTRSKVERLRQSAIEANAYGRKAFSTIAGPRLVELWPIGPTTMKATLRAETLAKLAILKAKAPERYRRLMYLEAKRRGLTKPKGLIPRLPEQSGQARTRRTPDGRGKDCNA